MAKYDKAHMKRAVELSRLALVSGDYGPFGAVIVKNGEIIAEGNNRVVATGDPTAHAEMVAIREACETLGTFQLDGCEIYTSCEPCPMCLGAIYWARIDEVFFVNTKEDAAAAGFDDSFIYSELAAPKENRHVPFIKVANTDARAVFTQWQQKPDKTQY